MGWGRQYVVSSPHPSMHTQTQLLTLSPPPHTLICLSLSLSLSPLGEGLVYSWEIKFGRFLLPKRGCGGGMGHYFLLNCPHCCCFSDWHTSWHVYLFVLRTQKLHLSWGTVGVMTAFAVQLAGVPARQLKLLPSKGALYAPRESKCHCRPSGSAPTTLDLSCHLFSLLSILWLDRHKG